MSQTIEYAPPPVVCLDLAPKVRSGARRNRTEGSLVVGVGRVTVLLPDDVLECLRIPNPAEFRSRLCHRLVRAQDGLKAKVEQTRDQGRLKAGLYEEFPGLRRAVVEAPAPMITTMVPGT
jgi:hypothetical protein